MDTLNHRLDDTLEMIFSESPAGNLGIYWFFGNFRFRVRHLISKTKLQSFLKKQPNFGLIGTVQPLLIQSASLFGFLRCK